MKNKRKGLVQVYTGNGKGKTTASLGLALRAIGHGMKVYVVQFMKGDTDYGEIVAARKLKNLKIVQFGRKEFVDRENPAKIDIQLARKALKQAEKAIMSGKYDIVVLDEINVALEWKLIGLGDVLAVVKKRPKHVELVLTGRYAHPQLVRCADLVTEMREVKHPYQKGVLAREGIEH